MPRLSSLGWLAFVVLSTGVTGCDHATKQLASNHLDSGPLPLVPNVVELRLTHNTDTAFGLLGNAFSPDTRWALLSALAAAATLFVLLLVVRHWRRLGSMSRVGSALVVGGALGNLLDRVIAGRVVDFIHVEHWPVFNVADIAITLGVGALLVGFERAPPTALQPP